MEAHPDVYGKGGYSVATLQRIATDAIVAEKIDWEAVRQVVTKREGVARPVLRTSTAAGAPAVR